MTPPLKLGIAGLGTVGCGVLNLLDAHAERLSRLCQRQIVVRGVSARDRSARRAADISKYTWHETPRELAERPDIDIFVELIGGDGDPALGAISAAFENGKHVITANKAVIARHGVDLAGKAESAGCALNFEAAVAGGIPIVKLLRENLVTNRIKRISGILNGTCNYILTTMHAECRGFQDVLEDAQAKGYAEADPEFDIGGIDAAHKLAILTTLCYGTELAFDQIYIEGIEHIALEDLIAADDLGYRIKLLAVAVDASSGIEQRVHPALVAKSRSISAVDGVFNAIAVEGDFLGELMVEGAGAGEGPTASAVVSDIVDLARGIIIPPLGQPVVMLKKFERGRMRAHEGCYYLRLMLHDKPGAMAAVANCMAEQSISLDSIVQKGQTVPDTGPDAVMQVVLITHQTTEAAIRRSLDAINADGFIAEKPTMIRIESQ